MHGCHGKSTCSLDVFPHISYTYKQTYIIYIYVCIIYIHIYVCILYILIRTCASKVKTDAHLVEAVVFHWFISVTKSAWERRARLILHWQGAKNVGAAETFKTTGSNIWACLSCCGWSTHPKSTGVIIPGRRENDNYPLAIQYCWLYITSRLLVKFPLMADSIPIKFFAISIYQTNSNIEAETTTTTTAATTTTTTTTTTTPATATTTTTTTTFTFPQPQQIKIIKKLLTGPTSQSYAKLPPGVRHTSAHLPAALAADIAAPFPAPAANVLEKPRCLQISAASTLYFTQTKVESWQT